MHLSSKAKICSIGFVALVASFFASSAAADPTPWKYASWGRAYVFVFPSGGYWRLNGPTDDIREDGYCVYLRVRFTGQSWPATSYRATSKSCGPIQWSHLVWATKVPRGVRLYRDDGRYMTLWGS